MNDLAFQLFSWSTLIVWWWQFAFVAVDLKMECVSFTLQQQFYPKYKAPGDPDSEEELLRTCRFHCTEYQYCFEACYFPGVSVYSLSIEFNDPPSADLWRCQVLLPLVSLALVFLSGLVGLCACLCRSFTPTLGAGVLHLLAGKRMRVYRKETGNVAYAIHDYSSREPQTSSRNSENAA